MSSSHSTFSSLFPQTAEIRKLVQEMMTNVGVPFVISTYDQTLHDICCKKAIEKGYPMDMNVPMSSLHPYIPCGVVMASNAYGHLDETTRVFVALYTALVACIDDRCQNVNLAVSSFAERFIRGEKQLDALLEGLSQMLKELPDYFNTVAVNLILVHSLYFINSLFLEVHTEGMKTSIHAKEYPNFARRMSGIAEAYAVMLFPRNLDVKAYVQCIPEVANFINFSNDVLSFYKEEIREETYNYVSLLSQTRGLPKMKVLQGLANEVSTSNTRIFNILEEDQDAHDAWQMFAAGYIKFHTSQVERYRLDELMGY